jgi:hypothetical protein
MPPNFGIMWSNGGFIFSLYVINTLIPPNLGTLVEDLYPAGFI